MRKLLIVLGIASAPKVGGQAIMEGVMMRHGDRYGLAVRRPDGVIVAESRPWFTLTRKAWLKRPFVRGCPILIETTVNGIKTLNRSAEFALTAMRERMVQRMS